MIGELHASAVIDTPSPAMPPRIYRRQAFYHAGYLPHTTRDGRHLLIHRWRSQCLTCGADYLCTTVSADLDKRGVTRNCPAHVQG